ncbi:hypothetical protein [Clostridium saccharoperbutylacetonicum]|uniref:hypothetical protein n=1 Tax=Clostridium saccharoperbutylacetonicum TaxID=36745 RepID=UPI000983F1D4|nr:hypothetical protein [Clostridium saccharoperbutylacetonicum]AQR97736.1 hypothetical protein CLSAP_50690 [Clostridium saccharoperbutylacetonicum]NSB33624.1 hypothetical protein [Clostridium saccharoperbutylacetonicum]
MARKLKSMDYIMLLSIFLIISVIVNIYSMVKLNNYKYKIGQQSYIEIEDFKQKNEINLDILAKSIEQSSIKNEDLLKLYKNYDAMSSDIMELWQQYGSYSQNAIPFFTKNIKTDKVMENEIHGKIKEYTLSLLNKEMKNQANKLVLKDDDLISFKFMYDISSKISNYFNEFNNKTLNNITGEEKEKKVINEYYWIDMLDGVYKISDDYINLQWKVESADIAK